MRWGQALAAAGRRGEAIEHLREAARLDPSLPAAHNTLGDIYLSQGAFQEAAGAYRAGLQAQPEHAESAFKYGFALENAGQLDEAINAYVRALELDQARMGARVALGQALLKAGRAKEAVIHLEQALTANPGETSLKQMLENAQAKAKEAERQQSVEDLRLSLWAALNHADREAVELRLNVLRSAAGEDPVALAAEGWLLQEDGELEQALQALDKAGQALGEDAELLYLSANLAYKRGDLARAMDGLHTLLRVKPDHVGAQTRLGSLLLKTGRRDEAIAAYERVLQLDPANALAKNNLKVLKGAA